jgi:hypothetical protein
MEATVEIQQRRRKDDTYFLAYTHQVYSVEELNDLISKIPRLYDMAITKITITGIE